MLNCRRWFRRATKIPRDPNTSVPVCPSCANVSVSTVTTPKERPFLRGRSASTALLFGVCHLNRLAGENWPQQTASNETLLVRGRFINSGRYYGRGKLMRKTQCILFLT